MIKKILNYLTIAFALIFLLAACSSATQEPVFATVGSDQISLQQYQEAVRHFRYTLISQYKTTLQGLSQAQADPSLQYSYTNRLNQLSSALDPALVGQNVLNSMVNNLLIRQEAKRRGITVTKDELDEYIQRQFGYFNKLAPSNLPDPQPTSTLNPTQISVLGDPKFDATPAPIPTSITKDDFTLNYLDYVAALKKEADVSELTIRYYFESSLYRQKVQSALMNETSVENPQEQVWVRHILLEDEASANRALQMLNNGTNFADLAAAVSLDTSSASHGGDLGWIIRTTTLPEFEAAAFSLPIGEISQPIKTESGYHIIQVLGHETRQLTQSQYQIISDRLIKNWLTEAWKNGSVKIRQDWQAVVPTQPVFTPVPLP